jgi:hypothetical protein
MGKMNALFTLEQRVAELTTGFFQCSEQEQVARAQEYTTELQPALLAAYGEDGPAHKVDPWMFDTYSDLYKDRNGVRPRGDNYRTMATWMANISPLPPLDDEEEVDGDRFDPDISGWEAEDDDLAIRVRDFEDVYGVSALGQAMQFMDMKEY